MDGRLHVAAHAGMHGDADLVEPHQWAPADAVHDDGVDVVLGEDEHRRHAAALDVRRVLEHLDLTDLAVDDVDEREAGTAAEVAGAGSVEAARQLRRYRYPDFRRVRISHGVSLSFVGSSVCTSSMSRASLPRRPCPCSPRPGPPPRPPPQRSPAPQQTPTSDEPQAGHDVAGSASGPAAHRRWHEKQRIWRDSTRYWPTTMRMDLPPTSASATLARPSSSTRPTVCRDTHIASAACSWLNPSRSTRRIASSSSTASRSCSSSRAGTPAGLNSVMRGTPPTERSIGGRGMEPSVHSWHMLIITGAEAESRPAGGLPSEAAHLSGLRLFGRPLRWAGGDVL